MRRSTTRDAATRAGVMITRGTIETADDSKKMQELTFNGLHDEVKDGVEHWQRYGFSAVPLPPSQASSGGSSGSSGSASLGDGAAGTGQGEKQYAEALVVSGSGSRSHPVVIAVDDRRHRPKNLKAGEAIQYDDQGQKVHLTRDGIVASSPKKVTFQAVDGQGNAKASITIEPNGTVTIKGAKLILDGMVYLGGADASKPASMQGSLDTRGDAQTGQLSTKVLVK